MTTKKSSSEAKTRRALAKCQKAYTDTFVALASFEPDEDLAGILLAPEELRAMCGEQYKIAMPALTDWDSIRAYIACVSQGLLLGVWTEAQAKTLMYTAQTALSTFAREKKTE